MTLQLPHPPAWMDSAACSEVGDLTLWFPEQGGADRAAEKVCATCEVRAECLAYALDRRETGIWGGKRLTEGRTA